MFFVVSFFKVLHLPLCSNLVSVTSFHDTTRKAPLAHHAPCSFGARTQGKQEGSPLVGPSPGEREPWKLPRMPHVSVGLFLSGMMDAHTHTHTLALTLAHTHPHTQEMIGLSELPVVHKACTRRPISSSMGYVWQFTPLGGK